MTGILTLHAESLNPDTELARPDTTRQLVAAVVVVAL